MSQLHNVGLYWMTNDLRIDDNLALIRASAQVKQLICVYIVDPAWFVPNRYGLKSMGEHRCRFLYNSLIELDQSLKPFGQRLLVEYQTPVIAIENLIKQHHVGAIFRSQNAGYYENQQWNVLQQKYPGLHFEESATHTIFSTSSLPFDLHDLPGSFSAFRKIVEPLKGIEQASAVETLPPPPEDVSYNVIEHGLTPNLSDIAFSFPKGGASYAKQHLHDYFNSELPSTYKQTRNASDGWQHSTKFSFWLANGNLSVIQILVALQEYENTVLANESTGWIRFELLWREYFQWVAHAYQKQLFLFGGIKRKKPLTSFYSERFQRWCNGNTPYPLVNACMKQLNATGYMSNRGRQIVASCLVNELNLDWRYGAAYFEQQLTDYDVASNWGNWQYLAGVGMDPRGKRHFNIDKQTQLYDPDKTFINQWAAGEPSHMLDSVDAADWPQ